ncbi:MAG: hypothetical protein M3R06_07165 [Chloroflexota bacterium]|nr:hypothetical protein [Chloroflexota bacterium]
MVTDQPFGNNVAKAIICPNCGKEQRFTAADSRCQSCGYLMNLGESHQELIGTEEFTEKHDPA